MGCNGCESILKYIFTVGTGTRILAMGVELLDGVFVVRFLLLDRLVGWVLIETDRLFFA